MTVILLLILLAILAPALALMLIEAIGLLAVLGLMMAVYLFASAGV